MTRRLPETVRRAVADAYAAGEYVADIAARYGVSPRSVCRIAGEYGVPPRQPGQPPKPSPEHVALVGGRWVPRRGVQVWVAEEDG